MTALLISSISPGFGNALVGIKYESFITCVNIMQLWVLLLNKGQINKKKVKFIYFKFFVSSRFHVLILMNFINQLYWLPLLTYCLRNGE